MILYHFSNSTSRYFKQDKFLCVNKKQGSPKITEEVYKMPRSKRILMFLLPRRYFYLHLFTTYYTRNKTRVKRKSVLYIKRVGRKTLTLQIRSMRTGSDALLKNWLLKTINTKKRRTSQEIIH
jgi:hypothetical protein